MTLIDWHSAGDVGNAAAKQKRPVLLFFAGRDSPKSQRAEHTVLTNKMVAKLIVDHFYPVRVIDGGLDSAKTIKQLHHRYLVALVPMFIITTPEGRQVISLIGCKPASQTFQFLKSTLESRALQLALDSEERNRKKKVDKRSKTGAITDGQGQSDASTGDSELSPEATTELFPYVSHDQSTEGASEH
jgi:hypothetical protein